MDAGLCDVAVRRDVLEGAEALLHARHPLAVRPAREGTTKNWVRKNSQRDLKGCVNLALSEGGKLTPKGT